MTSTLDKIKGVAGGLAIKAPVRVATTANIAALNGLLEVDDVMLSQDDRVLVMVQDDATQNGIWSVDSGDWSRAIDFDGFDDCVWGTLVFVQAGTANGGNIFQLITQAPIIGQTALNFALTGAELIGAASAWIIANLLPALTQAAARAALAALAAGDDIAFTGANTHAGGETFSVPIAMNGAAVNEAFGTSIASATAAGTLDLDSLDGNAVTVTGTTAVTAITLSNGRSREVRFGGALMLTNGASLVLPSGANITSAAGDWARFRGGAAGVVYCTDYERADGKVLVTSVAPPVYVFTSTNPAGTAAIPSDNTKPQVTEGNEVFSTTFTAKNAANRIRIECSGTIAGANDTYCVALFIDGAADAVRSQFVRVPDSFPYAFVLGYEAVLAAGVHTFSIRAGSNSGGAIYINGSGSGLLGNGTAGASLRISEASVV